MRIQRWRIEYGGLVKKEYEYKYQVSQQQLSRKETQQLLGLLSEKVHKPKRGRYLHKRYSQLICTEKPHVTPPHCVPQGKMFPRCFIPIFFTGGLH